MKNKKSIIKGSALIGISIITAIIIIEGITFPFIRPMDLKTELEITFTGLLWLYFCIIIFIQGFVILAKPYQKKHSVIAKLIQKSIIIIDFDNNLKFGFVEIIDRLSNVLAKIITYVVSHCIKRQSK